MDRFDRIDEPELVIGLVEQTERVTYDNVSMRLGLEHTTAADDLVHASISKAFKSGGFNGAVALDPAAAAPFDEESLVSYETGFKWTAPDNGLRVNIAAFYYDYSDLQVFTRVNTGGIPREILTNAADASVAGLEIEATARTPTGWDVTLAAALLDTELENFETFQGADLSGNELAYAPRRSLSGVLGRQWSRRDGTVMMQVDFQYQDDTFLDTSNSPLLVSRARWLWNARIAYRSPGDRWEWALWGRNLSDETYKVAVVNLSDFGFNNVTFSEPRTWGIEVVWRR